MTRKSEEEVNGRATEEDLLGNYWVSGYLYLIYILPHHGAYTAETLNNPVGKMTWLVDVNQSLSTATPVFAQWIQEQRVEGCLGGSCTKLKPHGRIFSTANLANEHYCYIPSLSTLGMKAESPARHCSLGPAGQQVANRYTEFLYLMKGSNLSSVK